MDRVCLIVPPSIFLLDERVFVNLGILKVAASLEQNGYKVDFLDLSGVSNYEDVVRDYVATSNVSWFGITATTPQMPAAWRIRKTIEAVRGREGTKVCIGGPHPTLIAAAAKLERAKKLEGRATIALEDLKQNFDVVVAGDGEKAIYAAMSPSVYGLFDADDPKGPYFLTNQAYEETPMPARHLVEMDSYRYSIEGHRATSLIAQLGCPFACGFCGGRDSPMLRRIRTRSTESIIKELRFLHETYGYTGFMFYDDELNVNKKMVELMSEIRRLQDDLKTEFRLRGFVKAELFTQEQANVMYAAGFRWLLTGFESGSPRILENINKKATREENTRAFEFARSAGLKVKALMSIGHPGESRETVEETRDWLLQMKPDDFDVTIITTYPGSPYYDHAVNTAPGIWTYTCPKSGDRLHAYQLDYNVTADYYKGIPGGGYKAYVYTDHVTSDELVDVRDKLESDVRSRLGIPFNPSAPSIRYEHSMGQGGFPSNILRKTDAAYSTSI